MSAANMVNFFGVAILINMAVSRCLNWIDTYIPVHSVRRSHPRIEGEDPGCGRIGSNM